MSRNRITRSYEAAMIVLAILALPAASRATTYKVDPEHTSVNFTVRHLLTQVRGHFGKFEGRIEFDPASPEKTKIEGTIDAASINTNVEERDKDLRSPRFFDVEKFPKLTFVSTRAVRSGKNTTAGKLYGNLTMHGVEKPVVLDVSYAGEAKDPWGNRRAGFTATATINRKDFGLTWNETLETGGVLVGDEVKIEIEAEGLVEQ